MGELTCAISLDPLHDIDNIVLGPKSVFDHPKTAAGEFMQQNSSMPH